MTERAPVRADGPPTGSAGRAWSQIVAAQQWAQAVADAERALADFAACDLRRGVQARLWPEHSRAYQGLTLATAKAANRSLLEAIQDFAPLRAVAARAVELAESGGIIFNNDKEIAALLSGPIAAPARPTSADPPPAALAPLLGAPTAALASLRDRFEQARDAYVRVHEADALLDELLLAHGAERAALGAPPLPERRSDGDPLAAIEHARAARDGLLADRALAAQAPAQAIHGQLNLARAAIARLRALATRNEMAVAEAAQKIASFAPAPDCASPESIAFFEQWRAKVAAAADSGREAAALVGAANLLASLEERAAHDSGSYARNLAPLQELAEIRGRFRAYKAKAKALAARGSPLGTSARLLEQACARALASTPCDLSESGRLCGAFEAALAALEAR